MDISQWSISQIMQLPDYLFGRRWEVGVAAQFEIPGVVFDISELALPEHCVIWSMGMYFSHTALATVRINLALGDVLPATDAQFDAYEPLFRDVGPIVAGRREIMAAVGSEIRMNFMRYYVNASGRRLVGRLASTIGTNEMGWVVMTISSLPREVPGWFLYRMA